MEGLNKKAFGGLLRLLISLAALLLLPAGTLDYVIILYLIKKDPQLLEWPKPHKNGAPTAFQPGTYQGCRGLLVEEEAG